jgi:hypothetical protein
MSATTPPARDTARSAAATNDRPAGYRRNSEVWLKNTRNGPSINRHATAIRQSGNCHLHRQ